MAASTTALADCLLDARARARNGVLVVTPADGKPVTVVFQHGNVRHVAPDLDILRTSGADPTSVAAALELGHELVVDRIAALAGEEGAQFTFRTDVQPPKAPVPLEVDPAIGVLKSFDDARTDEAQAEALGSRWEELLRPGPGFRDLIAAFEAAFPRGPVPRALVTGQTLSDLVASADDAPTTLRQVYAAVRCGLAELRPEGAPAARWAVGGPDDVPWSVEDDLVVSAPPPRGAKKDGRTPTNVEALLEQALDEGDPWIGAEVYPDVAARVIPRDARIRSGTDIERRPRTGVSSLIHPDTAEVALNLDLVEGRDDEAEAAEGTGDQPTAEQPTAEQPTAAAEPTPSADVPTTLELPERPRGPEKKERPRVLTVPSEDVQPAQPPLMAPSAPLEEPAPLAEEAPEAAAPAPDVAPAVLTVPPTGSSAPAPAAPSPPVLTVPPGTAPQAAQQPSRPVLTPPAATGQAAQPQPPALADDSGPSDEEEARIAELEEWIDEAWPHAEDVNFYRLLGVKPDAKREEIVKIHRALLVKFHPDRFERFDLGSYRAKLATIWEHVNKGIGTLTNDDRRKEYDIFLDRKARGLPTDPEVVVRAEQVFRTGEKLLQAGRYQEAKAHYEEAISLNRAEPEFHVAQAWAELQVAKHGTGATVEIRDAARATFDKALEEQPSLDRAHLYLGYLAKLERDMRRAVKHFREAAELNPYNVDAKREIRLAQMRADKDERDGDGGGLFGRFRKK